MIKTIGSVVLKPQRRRQCSWCGLTHHSLRQFEKEWICATCDYLELVRADSFQMREAIDFLREKCLCAYCGDPASDIEHVIPRSSYLPTFTVPACRECNLIASDLVFRGFQDKADYIKQQLQKKYKTHLDAPEWDKEELEEMGYGMRKKIEGAQAFTQQIKQRIEWTWLVAVLRKEH